MAIPLRPGKTPAGGEICNHLHRFIRRIRQHWPRPRITIRGDSHYGRPEVMAWSEANRVGYIPGLAGNHAVRRLFGAAADDVCVCSAEAQAPALLVLNTNFGLPVERFFRAF